MHKFIECIKTGLLIGLFCGLLFALMPFVLFVPLQLIIGVEPMSSEQCIGWLRISGAIGFVLFIVGFFAELSTDRENGSMM